MLHIGHMVGDSVSKITYKFTQRLLVLMLFGFLGTAPGLGFAQNASVEVPANAQAKSYGIGWECDKGYQKVNDGCVAIKIPANAYLTHRSHGRGWECNRGYREFGDTCRLVKVPANAYLDSRGDGWKCNRGYRADNGACMAIQVPANGFFSTIATNFVKIKGMTIDCRICKFIE